MAKKAKKTKKVSAKTLEAILIECSIAVGQGVGMSATVSTAARTYWVTTFKRTIKYGLSHGERWSAGRRKVIPLARKMGQLAVGFANPVTKTAAKMAADKVRADPSCPGGGAGKFC